MPELEVREDLSSLPLQDLLRRLEDTDRARSTPIFMELVRRFEPVIRKGWRQTRGVEYSEFANEVFQRAFGALPTLRVPLTFPLFFKHVVRSVAGDLMREARKAPESLDDVGDVLAAIDAEITVPLVVSSYLEYLNARERTVLELEFLGGYTTDEIASRIRMSAGGVRTLKSRALRKLRDVIDRDRRTLERLSGPSKKVDAL
ncbi:MAG TPA: sigma-70 family RNA polymerase sigma factor [Thermoanaerobaculia bacterium]